MLIHTNVLDRYDPVKMEAWLRNTVLPQMKPDVSNYAKGRLRVWLGLDPGFKGGEPPRPAWNPGHNVMNRLAEIIGWDYDYCLITYSGSIQQAVPNGITPHRDATPLSYQGCGLNLTNTAVFRYWMEREGFGAGKPTLTRPVDGPPSHELNLVPGDLVMFNTKNNHSCEPSLDRFNANFWRKK